VSRTRFAIALIAAWVLGASPVRSQSSLPPANDPPPDPEYNETIVHVPIALTPSDGGALRSEFVLTTFRPSGAGPFPTVIINHGRDSRKRAEFGRSRMLGPFLVRRGFAVLAPTRLGYGVSGAAVDPETVHGQCNAWNYQPQASAIRAHIRATIEYAARQPWVDKDNLLLAGGSVGGFGSVMAAGDLPRGLKGVINFSGGTGGRIHDPAVPACNPKSVGSMMAAAGRKNPVPSIWFYSENDRLWGPRLPREWHTTYLKAGGRAEFHMLPAFGTDGHDMLALTEATEHWRPLLDSFLVSIGYAPRKLSADAPAPTGFAALDDVGKVPLVSPRCRELYADFLKKDVQRAFAIGPNGACAYFAGQLGVMAKALARCADTAKAVCRLYAINDDVVWRPF
jgi:dienelactone hydrolase